jgi:predicted nucleotidyltransferase
VGADKGGAAMFMNSLKARRSAILALATRYGASRIRVFGSVARGEDRPDSDIDFLVDLPRGYDMFSQRLPLIEHLTNLLGRRIDVVREHELNRHIRERVLKEAVDL